MKPGLSVCKDNPPSMSMLPLMSTETTGATLVLQEALEADIGLNSASVPHLLKGL